MPGENLFKSNRRLFLYLVNEQRVADTGGDADVIVLMLMLLLVVDANPVTAWNLVFDLFYWQHVSKRRVEI